MKKENIDKANTICKEIDRLEKLRNLIREKNLVISVDNEWMTSSPQIKMWAGDDALFGAASLEFIARCEAAVVAQIAKLETELDKL